MAELDAGDDAQGLSRAAPIDVEMLSDVNGVVTFKVAGQLDISTERALREQLEPAISTATAKVVFDVAELTFMDSSGLAVLLGTAQQGPAVEVRNPPEIIRRLITIAGLREALPMVPDA